MIYSGSTPEKGIPSVMRRETVENRSDSNNIPLWKQLGAGTAAALSLMLPSACTSDALPPAQKELGLVRSLSKRSEFLAANRGLRFPMPGFVLLVRPRGDGDDAPGIGFTVSKKVGNAVTRNRMKRRFRALARAGYRPNALQDVFGAKYPHL